MRFGAESDDDQTVVPLGGGLLPLFGSGSQFAAATPAVATDAFPSVSSSANPILDDVIAQEHGGVLPYAGALLVLRKACQSLTSGVMNATLFSELTAVAEDFVNGSISASKYVKQMFENVVLGNSANAYWNGGDEDAVALGNLTATSRRGQFNELIDKWFLGGDMPGVASEPGASAASTSYQNYALPLFTSAGPRLADINQGPLGDCWFLAALGETAMLDPSLIETMISQHGNGTYVVRFEVNGQADYVTVNGELPTTAGQAQADGSPMAFASSTTSLWVPLVEKALAQLSEQSNVVTGVENPGADDQYYDLDGGFGEGISLITGQDVSSYSLTFQPKPVVTKLLGTLEAALAAGDDVLLGTSNINLTPNLVPNHMFAVTAINVATGMVTLENPWGSNAAHWRVAESFSISASTLAGDNATFFAAHGAVKS